MKTLMGYLDNQLRLLVRTTEDEIKEFELPVENIHYWYPFNTNYEYRFSSSKEYLYLVRNKHYNGSEVYTVNILKHSKPLERKDGTLFNPSVYGRNMQLIRKATMLGIPTITEQYSMEEITEGFNKVGQLINIVKTVVQQRYIEDNEDVWFAPEIPSLEWDTAVYAQATPEEVQALEDFGEILTMLQLMRKIMEGK